MDKNKIGLGKGLSAILGEIEEETSQVSALIEKKDVSGITFLPLSATPQIVPSFWILYSSYLPRYLPLLGSLA